MRHLRGRVPSGNGCCAAVAGFGSRALSRRWTRGRRIGRLVVGRSTKERLEGAHPRSRAGLAVPKRHSRWAWRRERDSNPRYGCPYTRFPSVRLQPLGHPSGTRIRAHYSPGSGADNSRSRPAQKIGHGGQATTQDQIGQGRRDCASHEEWRQALRAQPPGACGRDRFVVCIRPHVACPRPRRASPELTGSAASLLV
jgi:hypothetical protein